MRSLIRTTVIVLAALLISVWSIIPPEKQLRLGKDLAGGTSLVYSVQIKPGDPADVISRVIDVLKRRIDPNGLSEISIAQQGRDRIEITMPLPNDRVKALKKAYEDALKSLSSATLDESGFQRLMRLTPAERDAEIKRLAAGDAKRETAMRDAAAKADAATAAREAYLKVKGEVAPQLAAAEADLKTAKDTNADKARLDELNAKVAALNKTLDEAVDRTANAEIAAEASKRVTMAASLTEQEVRRALSLSNEKRTVTDSKTGQQMSMASAQEAALKVLQDKYPEQRPALASILKAYEKFAGERTRLDDPADLKRLLAGAGVLDFRITVDPGEHPQEARLRRELHERGPRNVQTTDARWYKINKLDTWFESTGDLEEIKASPAAYFQLKRQLVAEEFEGEYYVLCWDIAGSRLTKAEGDWKVAAAFQSSDPQSGLPAISFEMDTRGAGLLNELTKAHVGKKMAVMLDDELYTAPSLRSKIGKSGQITGSFDDRELNYIINVLAAGSLQAKLSPEPLSEVTLAPELGADNLRAGMRAGLISLIVIGGFMIVYYFGSGVIAVVALLANLLMILGLMSLNSAAFTMPGIAGVILTFGIAVDANVLIYERMREELQKGLDLRNATRIGFAKALSSIVDGNVTNLIHCVVLYFVGTQEIKGFAITMGIGVLTTLFSALTISRLIYSYLVDYGPWQRTSMLPLAIPAIDTFFHRKVNWLKLRWVFWTFSAGYVTLGMAMVIFRGSEMLDTQFRGGTQIVFKLKNGPDGRPMTMTRKDVEARLVSLGGAAAAGDDELKKLAESQVLPVNPQSDGVTSNQFTIKSLATHPKVVNDAIAAKFEDVLETRPALNFRGRDNPDLRQAPIFEVVSGTLGEDIQRPAYGEQIKAFKGGVAVVIENIDPPQPLAVLKERLARTRATSDYSGTLSRDSNLMILEGDDRAVRSAVLLAKDQQLSFFDDERRWRAEVAEVEWKLVVASLANSSTSASVEVFSPVIARSFTAQAIVAFVLSFLLIGIYIWVRFGAVSYALAAIVPLFHDVLTAIGLIALAQILYESEWGHPFAQALLILPFKIDLVMVASLLTIVGYSLNDTVIVLDRIRENRGKLHHATEEMINSAVNMTISRTVITSGTTLMAATVLYLVGGEGMRGFSYAMIIGIIVGTYSSIAVAAPMVWVRHPNEPGRPGGGGSGGGGTGPVTPGASASR